MFSRGEDNAAMTDFQHLLEAYDVGDLLDEIARIAADASALDAIEARLALN